MNLSLFITILKEKEYLNLFQKHPQQMTSESKSSEPVNMQVEGEVEVPVTNMCDDIDDSDDKKCPTVTLITNDGHKFIIPKKAAICSDLVKSMCDDDVVADAASSSAAATASDVEPIEIPMPNVHSTEMKRICTFMIYVNKNNGMKEIPKPVPDNILNDMSKIVEPWYAEFVNIRVNEAGEINHNDFEGLHKLMMATNYMLLTPLFELCACKIASIIGHKTPDQITQMFALTPIFPFTNEDGVVITEDMFKERVRDNTKWKDS